MPLITPAHEPILHGYFKGKITHLGGILHATGGMPDHIHLLISIPPKIAVAEAIRVLKGSSAYHLNQVSPRAVLPFPWQGGYGIFSVGGRQLTTVFQYIQRQKDHHAAGTLIRGLERTSKIEDLPPPIISENPPTHRSAFPTPRASNKRDGRDEHPAVSGDGT